MHKIEQIILSNLIHNEEFARKVSPFLKTEYFPNLVENTILKEILEFFGKYNRPITLEILGVQIGKNRSLKDFQLDEIEKYLNDLDFNNTDLEWLTKETENYCKNRAIKNAIVESFEIIEGRGKDPEDSIPSKMSEALAVSFDRSVGHDYFEDAEARFELYNRVEDKIPFDLELLNKITKGGLSKKTLNVILAGCVHPDTEVRIRYRPKEGIVHS